MLETFKTKKFLFLLGCAALVIAVLSVTIAPYLTSVFSKNLFISVYKFQWVSFVFYAITLFSFLFSSKYVKKQINWILITCAYFIIFQVIVKIIS